MCCYKKISSSIIFLIMGISLPTATWGQVISMIAKPSITRTAKGLSVDYEILNKGTDTAGHLTVTTFLARSTNHSDELGDLLRGETARYNLELNTAELLPGEYIMATRINFSQPDGQTHCTYHFCGVTIKPAGIKKDDATLALHLKSPAFNPKSFWHSRGKFILTMENNLSQTVELAVVFFLPDGFTVSEPEKKYTLSAHEKKMLKIPVSYESFVGVSNPYSVVIWHEADGRHYSQLFKGTIRVVAEPFLFKLFLVVSVVVVLALGVIYFSRRRKRTVGA